MNIIEDLYKGRIFPSENFVPSGDMYKAEDEVHQKMYDELCAKLTPEQQLELGYLADQRNRVSALEMEEMFYYAYSLCGKLIRATLMGDGDSEK